ncbi:hypothetical protein ACFC6U_37455 [Kitasatospora purpeofusca]
MVPIARPLKLASRIATLLVARADRSARRTRSNGSPVNGTIGPGSVV